MTVFDVGQLENYQSLLDDIVTSLMLLLLLLLLNIMVLLATDKVFIAVEPLLISLHDVTMLWGIRYFTLVAADALKISCLKIFSVIYTQITECVAFISVKF